MSEKAHIRMHNLCCSADFAFLRIFCITRQGSRQTCYFGDNSINLVLVFVCVCVCVCLFVLRFYDINRRHFQMQVFLAFQVLMFDSLL